MAAIRLTQFLDESGVPYETIAHTTAYTAQGLAAAIHLPGRDVAKSTVVKVDGRFGLAVLPAPRRVDLEALHLNRVHRRRLSPRRFHSVPCGRGFRHRRFLLGPILSSDLTASMQDQPLEYSSNRVDLYRRTAEQDGLRFREPPAVDQKIEFRCSYATNPDLGMYAWNKAVPQLAALRAVSQSVSLKMALTKIAR